MIRQSINCDICGAEKKQTNHWFVTYTQAGELRISTWNSSKGLRARTGSKHLCGQTCLTKLVDEFVAGVLSARSQPSTTAAERDLPAAVADTSLTSSPVHARVNLAPAGFLPTAARPPIPAAVVAISTTAAADTRPLPAPPPADDLPNYANRHWRSEAWERERERERRGNVAARRKN